MQLSNQGSMLELMIRNLDFEGSNPINVTFL